MTFKSLFSLTSQVFETMNICFNDFLFLLSNSYNIRVNTRDKLMVNIMLGMHSIEKGMSFPKMFVRTPKIEKELKEICKLPYNEIPIVLLLAGHYDLANEHMQPVSVRLNNPIERRK